MATLTLLSIPLGLASMFLTGLFWATVIDAIFGEDDDEE